ncbi:MAG: dynamin family protein [Candidatus Brocadiae bacterium]|nr:dynamin family protein [Candidatus Brocadiia bacterium]
MGFKSYEEYSKSKEKILQYLLEMRQPLEKIGLNSRSKILQEICERLRNDTFKVMVLGEFKRGKSTFVNALLGENILPAKMPPCTAVITEVKYGESPKAILHYNDSKKEPMEINIKDIGKYIVIKEESEPTLEKKVYKKLEVLYPLALCKNNVEIIDSPGLNENEMRQHIVEDYIGRLDAGILVLSCRQFFSKSEQNFLEEYTSENMPVLSKENLFIVANFFDAIEEEEEEIQDIKQRKDLYLGKIFAKQKIHQFYFLAAKQSLDAKASKNAKALAKSGLPEIEKALENFLAQDRGKIKIARAVRESKSVLREGLNHYPSFIATLKQDMVVLEQKQEEIRPRLEKLRAAKQELGSLVEVHGQALLQDIGKAYRALIDILVEQCYAYIQTYKAKTSYAKTKKYVEEIQEALKDKTQEIIQSWKKGILQPIFDQKQEKLTELLENRAKEFVSQVENLRSFVSGVPSAPKDSQTSIEDVSVLSKILGGAGGLILAGVGGSLLGSTFGIVEVLKNCWREMILIAVYIPLFWSNPIVLFGMFVFTLVYGLPDIKGAKENIEMSIKQKIWEGYTQGLQSSMGKAQSELEEKISAKFAQMQQAIEMGLQLMIDDISGQLKKALEERRSRQSEIEKITREMEESRKCLILLEEKLEEEYEKAVC